MSDASNNAWLAEGRRTSRPEGGRLAAFLEGVACPWQGLAYMNRHKALWRHAVWPIAINIAFTGLLLAVLLIGGSALAARAHEWFVANHYAVWWEIAAALAAFFVALAVVVAAWKLLTGVLCDYFYGKLAEKVALQLGLSRNEVSAISFRTQAIDAIRDFCMLALINIGLFALNCLPVFGSLVGIPAGLYFNCLILGHDVLALPMQLQGQRLVETRAFCRRHRYHTLGLGAVVLLFSLVPIVGAVLVTTAVTGAVLMYLRLIGRVAS